MSLGRRRLVRVPASSANLGPGYDVLAAAIALPLEVEVRETGEFSVETELDLPRDRTNLVVRAFERLHGAEHMRFRIESRIPLSGGLGSSAAAIVAGLLAADHMFELDADVLRLATELDGHADNVAAALNGGCVVCVDGRVHRLEPPPGIEGVLLVPHDGVRTADARAALPVEVPIGDVVSNLAHIATLMLGLTSGDPELIAAGLADRLHEPRRAHLYPRAAELRARAAELGALGASMSGAGPSVLFWCQLQQTGTVTRALRAEAEGWADVIRAPFESEGADVREL